MNWLKTLISMIVAAFRAEAERQAKAELDYQQLKQRLQAEYAAQAAELDAAIQTKQLMVEQFDRDLEAMWRDMQARDNALERMRVEHDRLMQANRRLEDEYRQALAARNARSDLDKLRDV